MPFASYTNTHKTSTTKGLSISQMGYRRPKDSGGADHHYKMCKKIMSKETSKQIFLYLTMTT
jgi:hypothetical protein